MFPSLIPRSFCFCNSVFIQKKLNQGEKVQYEFVSIYVKLPAGYKPSRPTISTVSSHAESNRQCWIQLENCVANRCWCWNGSVVRDRGSCRLKPVVTSL